MKTNLITAGTTIIAMLVLVVVGMMGCSSDPMSSQVEEPQASNTESDATEVVAFDAIDGQTFTALKGRLWQDTNGPCWYLVVSDREPFELLTAIRLPKSAVGKRAIVEGNFQNEIAPQCSNFDVLEADRIKILGKTEPKPKPKPNPLKPSENHE